MKPVKAPLMVYPQQDQHGRSHAGGQSKYIDDRERLVPLQIPDRYLKVIPNHVEIIGCEALCLLLIANC
jgi:hypothetical protein